MNIAAAGTLTAGNPMTADRIRSAANGQRRERTFGDGEFERRLAGLRTVMAEADVSAVVLTSMHNIKYYSDFLYTSFGRQYAMVVTARDTVTVTAGIDAGMPWRTGYGDNVVYTDWRRDNFDHAVAGEVGRRVGTAARVGIEADAISVAKYRDLTAALGSDLVDLSAPIMAQRMLKSAEEIALIEQGARIADLGGAAIRDALDSDRTWREYELALVGTEAMVHEIARTFPASDVRDTWVWLQSGINTDGAHNWPTTKTLAPSEILSLNCFPMTSGYYTALERTLFYGEPDRRSLQIWEANVEVHERGLALLRPGAVCSEIAAELNEIYAGHGLLQYRTFGYGHSFGVLSHYYGREAGLELREDIETVLVPGMVISMEPMVTIPDGTPGAGGYREHDIVVITEDGARNITGFPYGPEHNIIER